MKCGYRQLNRGTYGELVMIEWRRDTPKWVQVAEILKARIADGTYPAATPLPSEHKLVEEFGPDFSRGTARKVLTRLREEGVAYAVRGLGTFVAPSSDDGVSGRRGEG